jgi:hypothetical protein
MIDSTNYDERYVGNHPLPELLECENGTKVKSSSDWETNRRTELLSLFESQVYGKAPLDDVELNHKVVFTESNALNGLAIRQEIHIYLGDSDSSTRIDLQLYTPKNSSAPVPVFLGCNFNGNHAVDPSPDIPINHRWMRSALEEKNVVNHYATEDSRGSESSRWPLEMIIGKGFAVATFYYGDVEPDHAEGWKSGIRGQYLSHSNSQNFASDSWGSIAAWSWGLSRVLDYLTTNSLVDSEKVAVIGHSRLGKAALWAAALDQRFAMAISNNSGAGGASLARRNFGESILHLNENFPHWFCENFKHYNGQPEKLPVDMHELVALIAPRPIYIASAQEDKWADPKGEFLAGKYAQPVYSLFNKVGIGVEAWPDANTPVGDFIGYHVRHGKHDVTAYDWQQYLSFATRHLRNSS